MTSWVWRTAGAHWAKKKPTAPMGTEDFIVEPTISGQLSVIWRPSGPPESTKANNVPISPDSRDPALQMDFQEPVASFWCRDRAI